MGRMEDNAIERAARSMACLPFRRRFYEEIQQNAISSHELAEREDWQNLVFVPFSKERADEHFQWMIRLGILRREVDGQGLTNRVRLTPLGTSAIRQWKEEIPRAGLRERIRENFRRHRPTLGS
jgi:hypothetical protein